MRENNEETAVNRRTKLTEMIEDRTAKVGIIGLGYVGLPLAIHFGKSGFPVVGFDLDIKKIEKLLKGESYIRHVSIEPINEMIKAGRFDVTSDFSRLKEVDCILICVPTPLTDGTGSDLSCGNHGNHSPAFPGGTAHCT